MNLDDLLTIIDEKYTEVIYNGGFDETEDPMDYIDYKEVVANV